MLNKILALFLISSTAYADDGKFTLLAEQQPAPFEGVLFDPIATASIMTEKDSWKLQCDLEVEYNLDVANTEFELERKNCEIRYEALDQEYKLIVEQKDIEIAKLQETIKKQSPPNKWAWFGVGGASGVVATVIIAKQFIN